MNSRQTLHQQHRTDLERAQEALQQMKMIEAMKRREGKLSRVECVNGLAYSTRTDLPPDRYKAEFDEDKGINATIEQLVAQATPKLSPQPPKRRKRWRNPSTRTREEYLNDRRERGRKYSTFETFYPKKPFTIVRLREQYAPLHSDILKLLNEGYGLNYIIAALGIRSKWRLKTYLSICPDLRDAYNRGLNKPEPIIND